MVVTIEEIQRNIKTLKNYEEFKSEAPPLNSFYNIEHLRVYLSLMKKKKRDEEKKKSVGTKKRGRKQVQIVLPPQQELKEELKLCTCTCGHQHEIKVKNCLNIQQLNKRLQENVKQFNIDLEQYHDVDDLKKVIRTFKQRDYVEKNRQKFNKQSLESYRRRKQNVAQDQIRNE